MVPPLLSPSPSLLPFLRSAPVTLLALPSLSSLSLSPVFPPSFSPSFLSSPCPHPPPQYGLAEDTAKAEKARKAAAASSGALPAPATPLPSQSQSQSQLQRTPSSFFTAQHLYAQSAVYIAAAHALKVDYPVRGGGAGGGEGEGEGVGEGEGEGEGEGVSSSVRVSARGQSDQVAGFVAHSTCELHMCYHHDRGFDGRTLTPTPYQFVPTRRSAVDPLEFT